MTQVVLFDANNLPAHLANIAGGSSLNAAAEEFASVKFPVISAKDGRFYMKRDGERTLILRPKDRAGAPDEPSTYIDITIVNMQRAKTYYAGGYSEGSDDKPDCYSDDGVTPSSDAQNPQCATCALCPNNEWGTGTNAKGEPTKGKACSDVMRMAVVGDDVDDPALLRVPPASLKNLAALSKELSRHNVPINAVITRVMFDVEATGVLTFTFVGYLAEETYRAVDAAMNDQKVLAVCGKSSRAPAPAKPALAKATDEKPAAAKAAPAKAAPAKAAPVKTAPAKAAPAAAAPPAANDAKLKAARAKAAAAAAAAELAEAEAAAAAAEGGSEEETEATTTTTSSSFDDELARLIS